MHILISHKKLEKARLSPSDDGWLEFTTESASDVDKLSHTHSTAIPATLIVYLFFTIEEDSQAQKKRTLPHDENTDQQLDNEFRAQLTTSRVVNNQILKSYSMFGHTILQTYNLTHADFFEGHFSLKKT